LHRERDLRKETTWASRTARYWGGEDLAIGILGKKKQSGMEGEKRGEDLEPRQSLEWGSWSRKAGKKGIWERRGESETSGELRKGLA